MSARPAGFGNWHPIWVKDSEGRLVDGRIVTESEVLELVRQRDELAEALERIRDKAREWEGRGDAPFWNLGDIAAAELMRQAQK